MKKEEVLKLCEFIAEMHNKKLDAINTGLSPIEWLKTTRVYVDEWHANEWHIASELEKYYKNKQNEAVL